jgi:biotin transport system substrate-specific component
MTIAGILKPKSFDTFSSQLLYNVMLVFGGNILLVLSAKIMIPLPFTPVPITGQTFAVLLIGVVLGPIRGVIVILGYLTEAAAGLPVLAGGTGGFAVMLGPTGGYLVGFLFAAFVTGLLAEKGWDRTLIKTTFMMFLGNITIYLFGLLWLSKFIEHSFVFNAGLIPFIPGDIIKIAIAAVLFPSVWKLIQKFQPDEPFPL